MPGPVSHGSTPSRWSEMSEPPARSEGTKLSDVQVSLFLSLSLALSLSRSFSLSLSFSLALNLALALSVGISPGFCPVLPARQRRRHPRCEQARLPARRSLRARDPESHREAATPGWRARGASAAEVIRALDREAESQRGVEPPFLGRFLRTRAEKPDGAALGARCVRTRALCCSLSL